MEFYVLCGLKKEKDSAVALWEKLSGIDTDHSTELEKYVFKHLEEGARNNEDKIWKDWAEDAALPKFTEDFFAERSYSPEKKKSDDRLRQYALREIERGKREENSFYHISR